MFHMKGKTHFFYLTWVVIGIPPFHVKRDERGQESHVSYVNKTLTTSDNFEEIYLSLGITYFKSCFCHFN